MKKQNKKVIFSYIRQLKTALICSASMKKAFIGEVKHQITELEEQIQVLSMEDLHRVIGSPDEIARGFENREDIEKLKLKAKKYTRAKIIAWICFALAIIVVIVSTIVIKSNNTYYTKTNTQSHYITETK